MHRWKDDVVQTEWLGRALRIEFIERSRNESLGIEWLFAARDAECGGGTGSVADP